MAASVDHRERYRNASSEVSVSHPTEPGFSPSYGGGDRKIEAPHRNWEVGMLKTPIKNNIGGNKE